MENIIKKFYPEILEEDDFSSLMKGMEELIVNTNPIQLAIGWEQEVGCAKTATLLKQYEENLYYTNNDFKYYGYHLGGLQNYTYMLGDYDMLVCYLLYSGRFKNLDLISIKSIFIYDTFCLLYPENALSYMKTIDDEKLWSLYLSDSLYLSKLCVKEIKFRPNLPFISPLIEKELLAMTAQADYYFKYCRDEEEKSEVPFTREELRTHKEIIAEGKAAGKSEAEIEAELEKCMFFEPNFRLFNPRPLKKPSRQETFLLKK